MDQGLEQEQPNKELKRMDDFLMGMQKQLTSTFKFFSDLPHSQIRPPKRPKPLQPAKKQHKWATSLDTAHKINFESANSFEDILNISIDPDHIIGVERSDKGNEGLFFVDTKDGIYIAKRSFSIASEALCNLLALRLGVQVRSN